MYKHLNERLRDYTKGTTMKKYVAYYRVSTQKQGISGLGLEAQKQAVATFLKCKDNKCIIAEFVEVESGKKDKRIELQKALQLCKQQGAVLVIAKLDRLARNAEFLFKIKNSNVEILCCDYPEANTLMFGFLAITAQNEAEQISSRTRAALAAKKAQGFTLGNPANLTQEARLKGAMQNKINASLNENTNRARAYAGELFKQNLTLREIASKLNSAGFRTAKDKEFTFSQIQLFKKDWNNAEK